MALDDTPEKVSEGKIPHTHANTSSSSVLPPLPLTGNLPFTGWHLEQALRNANENNGIQEPPPWIKGNRRAGHRQALEQDPEKSCDFSGLKKHSNSPYQNRRFCSAATAPRPVLPDLDASSVMALLGGLGRCLRRCIMVWLLSRAGHVM